MRSENAPRILVFKENLLRLLFATSEIFPLIKTGGLADVSGALPIALQALGVDIQILLPAYRGVMAQCGEVRLLGRIQPFHEVYCELYQTTLPGTQIPLLLIDQPALFDRDGGPYHHPHTGDWHDNALRFGVLSKVAAMLALPNPWQSWMPDLVHCNDWQTGLTPYYLQQMGSRAKSIISIHNLAFQGNFNAGWRFQLGLNDADFNPQGVEFYGQLSFMKAGLQYASKLSTVSPTYANEIQTAEFGFGFEGLLQHRQADLFGILNGIDTQTWDPATDPYLETHYDANTLQKKLAVKQQLQKELGLPPLAQAPLLGVVSRLTYQKGLDMLPHIADALMATGAQLAILGNGEKALEQLFLALQERYPQQVAVNIGYHEPLSHRMMAGVDIFVMPSRFEPCGLNQMYGLRYGTIPVVANTGGLADSVTGGVITNQVPPNMTGFVMADKQAQTLLVTLLASMQAYANSGHWHTLQKQAMAHDVSWQQSAKRYLALYKAVLSD